MSALWCACFSFPVHESLLDFGKITVIVGDIITPRKDETLEQLRDRVRSTIAELKTKLPPVKMPETSGRAIQKWIVKDAAKKAEAAAAEAKTNATGAHSQ